MNEEHELNEDFNTNLTKEKLKELVKKSYLISVKRLKHATDKEEIESLKRFIQFYENF